MNTKQRLHINTCFCSVVTRLWRGGRFCLGRRSGQGRSWPVAEPEAFNIVRRVGTNYVKTFDNDCSMFFIYMQLVSHKTKLYCLMLTVGAIVIMLMSSFLLSTVSHNVSMWRICEHDERQSQRDTSCKHRTISCWVVPLKGQQKCLLFKWYRLQCQMTGGILIVTRPAKT